MAINLRKDQWDAVAKMKNGCIVCGGVGSGKSRVSIAYYILQQGAKIKDGSYERQPLNPCDLIIITTAKKRDNKEWESEMAPFLLSTEKENNSFCNKVIVDSWNNIKKYEDVKNSFFIFDEQRVVGYGSWSKAFIKISRNNRWILLSATPGDKWVDYIPVFIANGFYKNKKHFEVEHVIYSPYCKGYSKVDRYLNTRKLERLRDSLLVDIAVERQTVRHDIDVDVNYDKSVYRQVMKYRYDIYKDEPIENAASLCYTLRRVVNSDPSRILKLIDIVEQKHRVIVFYNFDYELEMIKNAFEGSIYEVAEWNGHKHQEIPEGKNWVYLVQYTAGAEGWNCVKTDTIIFYSQNYSYKMLEQSKGRIDRINTPFIDLYYYNLKSKSDIDLAIARALKSKKKFNEGKFAGF